MSTSTFGTATFVAGMALTLYGLVIAERDERASMMAILIGAAVMLAAIWVFAS